jgi:folylpolyglutamate synthase/dihydrofolate synthase
MKSIDASYQELVREVLSFELNPKFGLERVRQFLLNLGLTRKMYVVQIVGTNGKGSTSAFLDAILTANHIKTGRFTSPHLCSLRERIALNGSMITPAQFVIGVQAILPIAKAMPDHLSFFEFMVGLSWWIFHKNEVQVAILEAGLGGRYDATTACDADILGITPIDLDHQRILGNTVALIAAEKLAAARPGQTVISAPQKPEVAAQIKKEACETGFALQWSSMLETELSLFGPHQQINAGLAVTLAQNLGLDLSPMAVAQGLKTASWPGRFEVFDNIILDGAHNESGIVALAQALKHHPTFQKRPVVLIYAAVDGHDTEAIVRALVANVEPITQVVTYVSKNRRSLSHDAMAAHFANANISKDKIRPFVTLADVQKLALEQNAVILSTGSLYALGELRSQLTDMPIDDGPVIY